MELFSFFRGLFAWMATIGILWPLNIPLAALAYKIRNGPKELDIESDELWTRSTFASLVMALVTVAFVWLDWYIVDSMEFPSGIVHMVMVMGYIPAGMWIMTLFFGFGDLLDGLSTFTLYVMLPIMVLWTVNQILGVWNPLLDFAYDWIKPVEM